LPCGSCPVHKFTPFFSEFGTAKAYVIIYFM
jgi:hypothetical protein